MIITLSGTVTHKDRDSAVIEASGVGYQVHFHPAALAALKVGAQVRIWTHDHVREDSRDLYGFASQAEHALFLKLLAISGVGPKSAQSILTLGPVQEIEKMIEKADVEWLTRIPGVGKKTAQKIVLELKGKLAVDGDAESDEVVSALVGLGFSRDLAREAVSGTSTEGSVEDRLKSALKRLAR